MKIFVKLIPILLIVTFSTSLNAQKKEKVEVSPKLEKKSVLKKCNVLELGKVISKEKPLYPEDAKLARIGGTVKVDVLVDEEGNVSEINNYSGHELLKSAAVYAAQKAKFSPTICDGQVASINAVMIFNFIPFVITDNYVSPNTIEGYVDIKNDSNYYEAILFLTENYKIAFGYGDNKYHSEAPLTKGDFLHFLRLTLDFLEKRATLANKNPRKLNLFNSFNPFKIPSIDEITDFDSEKPYADSLKSLFSNYEIVFVDKNKQLNGKFPLTQNEVIDFWSEVFGKDAVPVNFKKIKSGDKILTRGEFSLFLQESLNVLTYKILP